MALQTDRVVNSNLAKIYIETETSRIECAWAKNCEFTTKINVATVPKLGTVMKAHKATSAEGSFKLHIYDCTGVFTNMVDTFVQTGKQVRFSCQVINDEEGNVSGRRSKYFRDCIIESITNSSASDEDGKFLEGDISGFFDSSETLEEFAD